MTNAQRLQGSWNEIRGQLKQRWGVLTDDDLTLREGNIDQVIGLIQRKTGEARDTIEAFLDQLTRSGASVASQAAQTLGNSMHAAGDRLREHWSQLSDQASAGYDQASRMVRENPTRSAVAVFGVGVAVGLLVGLALSRR
jgi:uncharacterized protein YjbJ (UPF0337 family)